MNAIKISCELTDGQASEFAQFLKRVSFREYRDNAESEEAAYEMRDAGEVIRRALADRGYSPR